MNLVPATRELLEEFYGEPCNKSVRGIVALKDGKPVAACIAEMDDTCWKMLMDWKPELRPFGFAEKRVLVSGFRRMLKMLGGLPIQAFCDLQYEGADKLLEHLGFHRMEGEVYEWRRSCLD